jgi:hypothetical protein
VAGPKFISPVRPSGNFFFFFEHCKNRVSRLLIVPLLLLPLLAGSEEVKGRTQTRDLFNYFYAAADKISVFLCLLISVNLRQ